MGVPRLRFGCDLTAPARQRFGTPCHLRANSVHLCLRATTHVQVFPHRKCRMSA
jgi:hypothetical protein